jgi:predicted ATPase/class 3 adenylate cyclase
MHSADLTSAPSFERIIGGTHHTNIQSLAVTSGEHAGVLTFLFTDIEGSSRLWEEQPEQMRQALACHDAILRSVVERNRGVVVKATGDGLHAAFRDPRDAVATAVEVQRALANPGSTGGLPLRVRCGMHAGVTAGRDGDFFGGPVNRAARIMNAAHGGQVIVSQAVADLTCDRLPDGVSLRDLGVVRLRDLSSSERVFQVAHAALRNDFPALRSLEVMPNNLPQQVTSFVGRERELADIKKLLGTTRLVTLFGAGGIGKTRLSLQAAADLLDNYPDGIWFVELAPLTDARLIPQVVASTLGVKEEAGRPVVEALVKFVKDRELLLILDNCEHLVHACAELTKQLLQSSPQLRVLASTREPLRVAGETTYPVPALASPDPSRAITLAALTQYESVRLFVDRAVAVQPAFDVTSQNACAITEICHQLDGIPLAIELAAARARSMPVEQIAARLTDRFRLLTGGDRTALPRQQTLRALIDWSYDLLTEAERKLLRRLAVFAGSFSLEAVDTVACTNDLNPMGALDLLTELIEKSLVVVDREGGRYRLLETVRQYAQERLAESGEADAMRARHAAYYLEFAEKSMPELFGPHQGAWLARFDLERENMLLVHSWYDQAEDGAARGLRLLHAIKPLLLARGMPGLGLRIALEALARPGARARNDACSRALFDAGQIYILMGRYAEARPMLEEGLTIAREIDDKRRVADILQPLGIAMLALGDRSAARVTLEEALHLARRHADQRNVAAALNALAQYHRVEGALDSAEPLYEQVITIAREIGDRESIAIGLLNRAMVYIGRGEHTRACTTLVEAQAISAEIGSKPAGQSVLEVCAGFAALKHDWARAARFFGAAEAQNDLTGLHRDSTDEAFLMPHIASARANLGAADFSAADAGGRNLSYADAMEEARRWLNTGA